MLWIYVSLIPEDVRPSHSQIIYDFYYLSLFINPPNQTVQKKLKKGRFRRRASDQSVGGGGVDARRQGARHERERDAHVRAVLQLGVHFARQGPARRRGRQAAPRRGHVHAHVRRRRRRRRRDRPGGARAGDRHRAHSACLLLAAAGQDRRGAQDLQQCRQDKVGGRLAVNTI